MDQNKFNAWSLYHENDSSSSKTHSVCSSVRIEFKHLRNINIIMHLFKDSSFSSRSQFQRQNSVTKRFQTAHTNQAASLKFSGMNLGDVMKVTVMEEMTFLKMIKDKPLDLSDKSKFQSWNRKDQKVLYVKIVQPFIPFVFCNMNADICQKHMCL